MSEFAVGDKVENTRFGIGKVVKVKTGSIGVRFNNNNGSLHDLEGLCEMGRGWWVQRDDLTLLSKAEVKKAGEEFEEVEISFTKEDIDIDGFSFLNTPTEGIRPMAEHLLVKYFEKGKNHGDISDLSENSVYIYCADFRKIDCGKELRLNIDSTDSAKKDALKNVGNIFYDINGVNIIENGRGGFFAEEDCVKLTLQVGKRGRIADIGVYDSKNNIMILCDISHEEMGEALTGQLSTMKWAFSVFEEEGIIKQRAKKRKSKKPQRYEAPTDLKLGADPELEELRSLDTYEPCETTVSGGTAPDDYIGRDHQGDQIELRPIPSETAKGVVSHLKELFEELPPVSTRGDTYPIGGHIHFGSSSPLIRKGDKRIVRALDLTLGNLTKKANGTARGGYLREGAIETKPYGFEYRTPPASWLFSPQIAELTLKLAQKVVMSLFIKGGMTVEVDKATGETTKKSFLQFLTEKETDTLWSFYKEYTAPPAAINANWVTGKRVLKAACTFNDDIYKHAFKSTLMEAISKLRIKKSVQLYFYGLSSSRGNSFAGISVDGFDTIAHPYEPEDGSASKVRIGLPRIVRSTPCSSATLRSNIEKIITGIKRELRSTGYYDA